MNETKQALEAVAGLLDHDGYSPETAIAAVNFLRTHGPALIAALEDARRLDAIEAEVASGGPIVLHNGEGTNGMRGLGMTNTGRTLRKAIDSCCGLDAMAAGGDA